MYCKPSNHIARTKAPSESIGSEVHTADTDKIELHHRYHHLIGAQSSVKKESSRVRQDTAQTLRSTSKNSPGQRKVAQFLGSSNRSFYINDPALPLALSVCAPVQIVDSIHLRHVSHT